MKSLSTVLAVIFVLAAALTPLTAHAHDAAVNDMSMAANLFITSLDNAQKKQAVLEWQDDKREGWHFVPDKFIPEAKMRYGLSMKKMTPRQRLLSHALLSSGLSNKGYLQASTIMTLEQILHDLENKNPIRDPQLYYVSVFGKPSNKGTWSWRLEGHHLSLNFTIVDGHHISVTPSFFGTNPGRVKEGPFQGLQVLKREEIIARQLAQSLSPQQRESAIIAATAPADVITGQKRRVSKKPFLPVKGISYDKLSEQQQKLLLELTNEYVSKYRADILDDINSRDKILSGKGMYFAWAGSINEGEGHYYRIQTPKWLFEYDNTQNDVNHVHAVWRDFDGDFGADLLLEHYEKDHTK
jgi:hypothetical protein